MKLFWFSVCSFDVKDHVTGFGNPDWKNTHEAADKTALVVTTLLKNGATCVGKTVMDELSFGYYTTLFCLIYLKVKLIVEKLNRNEDNYFCLKILKY